MINAFPLPWEPQYLTDPRGVVAQARKVLGVEGVVLDCWNQSRTRFWGFLVLVLQLAGRRRPSSRARR